MSKEAMMFDFILNATEKYIKQIEAMYFDYSYMLSDREKEVIEAMLALAED